MILADTSVWIDYLAGRSTPQANELGAQLARERVTIGDLVLMEILRGARESQVQNIERRLAALGIASMGGRAVVLESARYYRFLRARGMTVRSTIDCLIATYCIQGGHTLLHSDRDFDPFEQHLGLRVLRA